MQLRYLTSSSVVVEHGETVVLCDPWLLDGAFYGAWAQYPPLEFGPAAYDHADYIYISDSYPDHFHRPTMKRLDSDTPVLVQAGVPSLKREIEQLGFDVTELSHGDRTHLAGELHLNVMSADPRRESTAETATSAGPVGMTDGGATVESAAQTDTLAVFDDGEHTVVNANDCKWPLAEQACETIDDQYSGVDLLLIQYAATNFYPQSLRDYNHEEKLEARDAVIEKMYRNAEGFINALAPDYYMPFAGNYLLSGPLTHRNEYVASPTRAEAFWHFMGSDNIDHDDSVPLLLNSEATFDFEEREPSKSYTPIDRARRSAYIEDVLAERSLDYENDERPSVSELADLLDQAYSHMDEQRRAMGWASDTKVLLDLPSGAVAALSMSGDGYTIHTADDVDTNAGYVRFSMDDRLLARILRGPEHARFDIAQTGSHINIQRQPDVYERALYETMRHLHA